MKESIDERYKIAAAAISKAGGSPIPTNDTLLKLLTYFIMEVLYRLRGMRALLPRRCHFTAGG